MADWVAPVMGLAGVALGAGIAEFRHWRESRERYQAMSFERRLEAHQEAYYYNQRFYEVLNSR